MKGTEFPEFTPEMIRLEAAKLMAETANMIAETKKFHAERWKLWVVIAFYPFGFFSAGAAAMAAYFKYFS